MPCESIHTPSFLSHFDMLLPYVKPLKMSFIFQSYISVNIFKLPLTWYILHATGPLHKNVSCVLIKPVKKATNTAKHQQKDFQQMQDCKQQDLKYYSTKTTGLQHLTNHLDWEKDFANTDTSSKSLNWLNNKIYFSKETIKKYTNKKQTK